MICQGLMGVATDANKTHINVGKAANFWLKKQLLCWENNISKYFITHVQLYKFF